MLQLSCSYHFGYKEKNLIGGYKRVAVPIFINSTNETGIEVFFTNALVKEIESLRSISVVRRNQAPAYIVGDITNLVIKQESLVSGGSPSHEDLPINSVLSTQQRVELVASLKLIRASDKKVLWTESFKNEKVYASPQLESAILNSANATYNQSARRRQIALIAEEMMSVVSERITEKF